MVRGPAPSKVAARHIWHLGKPGEANDWLALRIFAVEKLGAEASFRTTTTSLNSQQFRRSNICQQIFDLGASVAVVSAGG